jgi:phospholipid-binding lipoprotein MlaA
VRGRDRSILGGQGSIWLLALVLTVVLSGCGTFSGLAKTEEGPVAVLQTAVAPPVEPTADPVPTPAMPPAVEADASDPVAVAQAEEELRTEGEAPTLLSQVEASEFRLTAAVETDPFAGSALAQRAQESTDAFEEEYDPWEPFNEKMFAFNRGLDRWVFKPAARAYMVVMPEPFQVMISNGFDNINFVPRFVNSLLQGKWGGAGRELGRFLINSTAGIGGLFDPAKDFWGIQKSREDFGQTLGVWGSGPGPYLVLPFMEPLTVRDGIGKLVDGFMDPLSYVLPFVWDRLGMKIGDAINERALNYDLFQGFEESVIDMYSAVRHGYLQRRQQLIKE